MELTTWGGLHNLNIPSVFGGSIGLSCSLNSNIFRTHFIKDMTEKVIDLDIVDSTLLTSQRNTDNRPTTDDPGEAKASPQQTMDIEEEIPFFTKYAHLVPTAKSLAPESEEDELNSSSEVVNKKFDKVEFLNKLQTGISQLISTLLEEPTKTREKKTM